MHDLTVATSLNIPLVYVCDPIALLVFMLKACFFFGGKKEACFH